MSDVRTGSSGMTPTQIVQAGIVAAWNGGLVDNITWIRVPAPGGFEVICAAETFSVQGLRLPASFDDILAMCFDASAGRFNNILPMTREIEDARYAFANPKGVAITVDGPPPGAGELFNDPGQVFAFNRQMDSKYGPVGKILREGQCKHWIVTPDLEPGAAINSGFRRDDGSLIQVAGKAHNSRYKGYSQQYAATSAQGYLNGKPVNLLDQLAKGCALGKYPEWLVSRLRGMVA